jgi:hypothetical protein
MSLVDEKTEDAVGKANQDSSTPVAPKEYDTAGDLKVVIGPKAVAWIHELNGFESLKADAMVGGTPTPMVIMKLYALFSVTRLERNGIPVILPPTKNDLEVWARAKSFTGRELMVLLDAYANEFMGSPTDDGEALKNESTPLPE